MKFIKLVINELSKILKRKILYIFALFAIISMIISCILVYAKKKEDSKAIGTSIIDSNTISYNMSNLEFELNHSDITDYDKKVIEKQLELYQYMLDNGVENVMHAQYKSQSHTLLVNLYKKLYSLDEELNKAEYKRQKNNIERLTKIFESGTFEEYVQFNKDLIQQQLDTKEITEEQYIKKIEEQDEILRYEIGKYLPENTVWKERVRSYINRRQLNMKSRVDLESEKKYLEDKDIERLKNQILIDNYRLENNLPPYYLDQDKVYDLDSYSRYKYNDFANTLTIACIGLLIIVLASSAISDEISKGTIKFALIAPYKRSELLLAKIVSLLIIIVAMVIITSQISVFTGNIVFGADNNEYLYVKDGKVQVMNTYTYETLQYLLRIPELVIYMLIGITLSSLTKNTPVSTIITSVAFIGIPAIVNVLNQYMVIDFVRYLPFTNFNFADRIFKIETYFTNLGPKIYETSIEYSIGILILTAILLLITVFDSFNKKQI